MKLLFADIPVDLLAGEADESGSFRVRQLPGRCMSDVSTGAGRASIVVLIRSGDAVYVTLTLE